MSIFLPNAKRSTRPWPTLPDWYVDIIKTKSLRERSRPFPRSINEDYAAALFGTGLFPDSAFRYWKVEFGLDKEQPRKRPASPAGDERQNKRPRLEGPTTEATQMASPETSNKPAHPTGKAKEELQFPKDRSPPQMNMATGNVGEKPMSYTLRPLTLRFNNSNASTWAHTTIAALENASRDPPQLNTEGPHPQDEDLIGPIDDDEQMPTLKVENVDKEMKFLFE